MAGGAAHWPEAGYPCFSPGEMRRRREALADLAREARVDRLVVYGVAGQGHAVQWLTGWPVSREALAVWGPGEPATLFVQFRNHVPLAREVAGGDAEVRWGGPDTAAAAAGELARRGGSRQRVGVIGPLPASAWRVLAGWGAELVDLTPAYTRLRLVKSAEEIAWLRAGAELTDRAVAALWKALRPGLTEFDLADVVERACVPLGGSTHIHYFSVTPMAAPDRCVPAQFPSARRVRAGDAVACEVSAAFWGYAGQLLRTFAVEAEPTPLYRELHAVAEEALAAALRALRPGARAEALLDAMAVVERAGFTLCDDLVHGFGGGYLPPVVGPDGFADPADAALELRPGMCLVVQPNVITRDGRAGVQTGELFVITEDGVQTLHRFATGLLRAPALAPP